MADPVGTDATGGGPAIAVEAARGEQVFGLLAADSMALHDRADAELVTVNGLVDDDVNQESWLRVRRLGGPCRLACHCCRP